LAVFLVTRTQKIDDLPVLVGQRNAASGGDDVHRLFAEIRFQQIAVVVNFLFNAVEGVAHNVLL
jgi:hypothetical protein